MEVHKRLCCPQSAETILFLNFAISVHEVFTLHWRNNVDYASCNSNIDWPLISLPNKGARFYKQSQAGTNILSCFSFSSISASLWKKTSLRDWSSASGHEILRSHVFHFKFKLSLFLLLNIWSQSFDQQFPVSCNFKLEWWRKPENSSLLRQKNAK